MARTATQRQSTPAKRRSSTPAKRRSSTPAKRRSPNGASKNGARGARATKNGARATKNGARATKNGARATKKAAGNARESVKPSSPITKLAGAAAKKALSAVGRRVLEAGGGAVRSVGERTAGASRDALESALSKRLPIQVSIDVAVPLAFAWDEWMTFEWMTEGVNRIVDVERDGDQLFGALAGARSPEWVADIVDEREEESFAWRSVEGTDCAGLATFHHLSERLTRIELDLDVLPTNPAQAASLALRIGRRRAEAELRRFKAHVEFINPDVYESDEGEEPEGEEPEGEEPEGEEFEGEEFEGEEPEDEEPEDEDQ